MRKGAWFHSKTHHAKCQLLDVQSLWGLGLCRIWLPNRDIVATVPDSDLIPIEKTKSVGPDYVTYIAAAARVADALTQDVLLAPIEASVIPLPHQLRALSRAISGERVRYLLADEVGLGKTIEAGLILRELKLRGLAKRILVIAPKGLVTQWVSEMRFHFGETFQLVLPEDIKTLKRIAPMLAEPGDAASSDGVGNNSWQLFSQVVVPMDSVKPLEGRRGWTAAQVGEYNRDRFEDLVSAGWDLVIVDEAHRLGGSTDQVARFRLGQGLAEAAPYLLLLSATPHQGKTDAFYRLLSLLDTQAFPDVSSVTRDRVQPYVIRTEKRHAIDADGQPLFKPRRTELTPVSWGERHRDQQLLYEAVTEYVRDGYNQAVQEKRSYIGFLMILMQRLVVSSTSAIRTTLARRLEALVEPQEQMMLFPLASEEEWGDLDGQEQVDLLLRTRLKALKNERAEVELLLAAAVRCEQRGPDAKAEALLDWLYRLQAEEGDPDLKALVFTEFVPTQEMMRQFLTDRGFSVVCLNGSMSMDERKRVQDAFAKDARVLISTDAGGEGLNLQFCHVVINYDIPWNPMRLEQRIGRVDRIGQTHAVRAINFVFEDSVEFRVREVLEQKLKVIFEEFGIDKTGDVLDSVQAGQVFDEMYVDAMLNPDRLEESVQNVVARLEAQARDARTASAALGAVDDLTTDDAQRLRTHPLPHWVERMTVNYLKTQGGSAEKVGESWRIKWPDKDGVESVVFSMRDAERCPSAKYLTLESPRIRGLALQLPPFTPGQPIPVMSIPGVSEEVLGFWSLWRISISATESSRLKMMPLFLSDEGTVYLPTSKHIWEQLLATTPTFKSLMEPAASNTALEGLQAAAELHGKPIYDELVREHRVRIAREREKALYSFEARRKAIRQIGLPQVREHRLALLTREERKLQDVIAGRESSYPEMTPLLVIRLEGVSHA
jgi:superfamily II DNA or RNA helicase